MLKNLFNRKKNRSKSVNDMRKRKVRGTKSSLDSDDIVAGTCINTGRAQKNRESDIRKEINKSGRFIRPDVDGAIALARSVVGKEGGVGQGTVVNRALRLKGSAQVIDDTLAHPSLRYLALAIIRGLLAENEKGPEEKSQAVQKSQKKPQKIVKKAK